MKRLLCKILLIFAFFCLSFASPALAGDAGAGKGIFTANCNACHMGGGNVVAGPSKGLAKNYLEKNGVDTLEKIVYQVTNGKNAMPAFGGRLDAQKIEDVATYVLSQAEAGW
ncbi:cytochrome c6 PetJ [Crocosphaera watsonii WH 8501]|uniref:Cytochrome c, class I n=5 Tax=Crocosphaera watsonii TaxID=263511 RepID=Q4C0X0_CROWT|nr:MULTISPECIES: c-type cytochrome [Crocosphaera]EAM49809.1 Cytochrome c, class I [Crocosphaera watsonii WH 8501]EHJ11641.1 Cytochrome C553 (soluble cytochrome f) [Crocosphaera watsonii WH 0003]MCH2245226.1 c-type cytochrome [Crocosphaera sp.]CCQ50153.1 Cytochrome C553 (soluble cytochrome f) [Crocosphaera watsonii WH 8502]CCQ58701.1 Cytochrome C553 (soluble cytochrome f) [Crocosphaera watsonii WH 0005]